MAFIDPNVLKLDETVLTPPKSPQIPTGFWDKVQAANSSNLVMGMQPDDFAVMMGRLGGSIVPDTSYAGRFAQGVQDIGLMKREQRLKEQSPEYRLANAKTNALLGTQPAPEAQAPVAGPTAQTNPTNLTLEGLASNLGRFNELSKGNLENTLTQSQIAGNQAQTNLTLGQTPGLIQQATAQGRLATSHANVAEATQQTDIEKSSAELEALRSRIKNEELQNRYYVEEHVSQPRAHIANAQAGNALGWANLGVRKQELEENRAQRRLFQSDTLNKSVISHVDTVAQQTARELDKILPSNKRGRASVYATSGENLIRQGLTHFHTTKNYADIDGGSSRQIASQTIGAGFKYLVQGINEAPDVKSKAEATIKLLGEIDYLSKSQPELAKQIEAYYFGAEGSDIQRMKPQRSWWEKVTGANTVPFDPYTVHNIYRGKKK